MDVSLSSILIIMIEGILCQFLFDSSSHICECMCSSMISIFANEITTFKWNTFFQMQCNILCKHSIDFSCWKAWTFYWKKRFFRFWWNSKITAEVISINRKIGMQKKICTFKYIFPFCNLTTNSIFSFTFFWKNILIWFFPFTSNVCVNTIFLHFHGTSVFLSSLKIEWVQIYERPRGKKNLIAFA